MFCTTHKSLYLKTLTETQSRKNCYTFRELKFCCIFIYSIICLVARHYRSLNQHELKLGKKNVLEPPHLSSEMDKNTAISISIEFK